MLKTINHILMDQDFLTYFLLW